MVKSDFRMASNLRPLTCLAALVATGGCATSGATLRSNHYRVSVPPGWQVVEAGGADLPTVLRVPGASDGAPGVELRVYAWLVEAPPAEPVRDAFARLSGQISNGLVRSEPEPLCAGQSGEFSVFGQPARRIHATVAGDRPAIVTAGYASGSLVAVIGAGGAGGGNPSCTEIIAIDSAVRRLTDQMAPGGDLSGPPLAPVLLERPPGGTIEVPPADPRPPP